MREELLLYHNINKPLSLGCTLCLDKDVCGGLQASVGLFDCLGYCKCTDPNDCQYVCRRDVRLYISRFQEVRGFGLENIPRARPIAQPRLPLVVPFIYHSSRRRNKIEREAVAVPLSHLFDHRTGLIKFKSKQEVANYFGFDSSARLILDGVNKDQGLENYWSKGRAEHLVEQLIAIEPDLVTTPNYSLFLNVPRWDNLHNMKRIAICWSELTGKGIPVSLHLNARTDRDWQRWMDFIVAREEVQSITVEFATGAAVLERGRWLVEKLRLLPGQAGRNLQLVMRGGYRYIDDLFKAFGNVVFIDTGSFVKTMKRRKFLWRPNNVGRWHRVSTPFLHPLDDLLQHNISTFAQMVTHRIEGASSLTKR